jgi:hypothetical protein
MNWMPKRMAGLYHNGQFLTERAESAWASATSLTSSQRVEHRCCITNSWLFAPFNVDQQYLLSFRTPIDLSKNKCLRVQEYSLKIEL